MSTVQKGRMPQKPVEKTPLSKSKKFNPQDFPFGRENYIIMVAGVVLMIIGYFCMAGKENIFSFTKISLSVIFILAGFVVEIFAIMLKPKSRDAGNSN